MPSYVITGASRGLGAAFVKNLATNPENIVIGLVRNVADTEARISEWKTSNIHIIQADMTKWESLQKAAEATAAITSGSLDYLIANAAVMADWSLFDPLSVLGQEPQRLTDEMNANFLTNVIGNTHLINFFMPLILKGNAKKVLVLTSGMADHDLVLKYGVYEGGPYAIGKAALNMVTSKFQAEFQKDGVLFIGVSPGVVETGLYSDMSEENQQKFMIQGSKFAAYAPHFKAADSPADSAKAVLGVLEKSSLANGDGGAFVSHLGTKQWL